VHSLSFITSETMSRCIICGKKLASEISIYCPDCEYELKRVRLKGEESLSDYIARVEDKRSELIKPDKKIKNLMEWDKR